MISIAVCVHLVVTISTGGHLNNGALVINELLAENGSTLADEDGDYSDWIELYNGTDLAVSLNGYTLTDDLAQPRKWTFPDINLEAGEFLLVWCSGKDRKGTTLHTNFRLSKNGETVGLYRPDGQIVEELTYPAASADMSIGRYPDGEASLSLFPQPTPGASNTTDPWKLRAERPAVSHASGSYGMPQTVELSSPMADAQIYYTLDGSEPGETDYRYDYPLTIDRTTVLRAKTYRSGMLPSSTTTRTLFFNIPPSRPYLPILSLVTEPANMWDPVTGIYENATERGRNWERPVTFQFFEKGLDFAVEADAGIRIHGGASRKKSQKHSFRIYFRNEYGLSKLDYPIIPGSKLDQFDDLVLRGGYNDSWTHSSSGQRKQATYIRDEFNRSLFLGVNQPASVGTYIHLYLNGEYWGLYNLVERYNDDFFDTYFEAGDWDIVKPGPDENANAIEPTEGDLNAWNLFVNWFSSRSFSDSEKWDELLLRVDLQNFLDFYILNVWIQNADWPRHNWYAARKRDDPDARWYFLPWDTESTLGGGGGSERTSIDILDKIRNTIQYPLSNLFYKLESSPFWGDTVMVRLEELRRTVIQPDSIRASLNHHAARARPGMSGEGERWGQLFSPEYSYGTASFDAAVHWIEHSFFAKRDDNIDEHLLALRRSSDDDYTPSLDRYQLSINYPNPFSQKTTVGYIMKSDGLVRFHVFDLRGRLVRTLISYEWKEKGVYLLEWDGRDQTGRSVSSGIYLLRMQTKEFSTVQMMVVVR